MGSWPIPFDRIDRRLVTRSVSANWVRSLVATAGVGLGVFSVVMVTGLAEGARREVKARFQALGSHSVVVEPRALAGDESRAAARLHVPRLSVEDAAFLRREVTGVRRVLPEFSVSTEVASVRGRRIARVMGGTSASLRARGLELATGRLATEDDDLTGARVCLLEVRLARELLGTEAPALVRLGTRVFAVIGTFRGRRAPEASVLGEVPDLVVPGSSLRGSGELLSRLIVEVDPAMAPSVAARRIERALLDRRRGVANVSVLWPERLLAERRRADRAIWGVLVGSAALCLLVGVAGISNTMLATLAERRREIGIQRALGASARRVFRLVLLEAVALSALGGAIGLAAGLVAIVGARLVGGTALAASPSSIAVALPLILGLGIVAGLYPARRASSVEPAEMLRI